MRRAGHREATPESGTLLAVLPEGATGWRGDRYGRTGVTGVLPALWGGSNGHAQHGLCMRSVRSRLAERWRTVPCAIRACGGVGVVAGGAGPGGSAFGLGACHTAGAAGHG